VFPGVTIKQHGSDQKLGFQSQVPLIHSSQSYDVLRVDGLAGFLLDKLNDVIFCPGGVVVEKERH